MRGQSVSCRFRLPRRGGLRPLLPGSPGRSAEIIDGAGVAAQRIDPQRGEARCNRDPAQAPLVEVRHIDDQTVLRVCPRSNDDGGGWWRHCGFDFARRQEADQHIGEVGKTRRDVDTRVVGHAARTSATAFAGPQLARNRSVGSYSGRISAAASSPGANVHMYRSIREGSPGCPLRSDSRPDIVSATHFAP